MNRAIHESLDLAARAALETLPPAERAKALAVLDELAAKMTALLQREEKGENGKKC